MSDHQRAIYHGENGDRWFLCRDGDSRVFILHKPTCLPAEHRPKSRSKPRSGRMAEMSGALTAGNPSQPTLFSRRAGGVVMGPACSERR
jgi:hypothetical protein